jgi:uncharacterized protein YceH (UPF0502 family)
MTAEAQEARVFDHAEVPAEPGARTVAPHRPVKVEEVMHRYAQTINNIRDLGERMDREFAAMADLEKELRELGLPTSGLRFAPHVQAAVQTWRGDPFWERT